MKENVKKKIAEHYSSITVVLRSKNKPREGEPLKIYISTKNTIGNEFQHNSKRPLKGEKRSIVSKQLNNDLAFNWRRKNVEDMEFGSLSPPNLYRNNILRKAKQEYKEKSLGISTKDPVKSLIKFKQNSSHNGSIHNIGIDPFVVHYWSDHQIIIYKDLNKEYSRLSIDATGGLVKKLKRTSLNLSSSYIFLYEAVISTNFGHIPVAQMLSEKQDTLTIWNWLEQWKKYVDKEPKETVCDYSRALLGALTRVFCDGMNLKTYTDTCFLILNGNNNVKLPKCYIRLDVAHIIKIFCRFKDLTGKKNQYLKVFYVRGLRLLLTAENLSEFKTIIEALITVMVCETDGWLIGGKEVEKSPSEKSRDFIMHLIKTQKREEHIFYDEKDILIDDETENIKSNLLTQSRLYDMYDYSEYDNENISTEIDNCSITNFLNSVIELGHRNSTFKGNK